MKKQQIMDIKEKDKSTFFSNKIKCVIKELAQKDIEEIQIYTIEEIKENYNIIPIENGVYFILNLGNEYISFTSNIENTKYKGKNLVYEINKLKDKYSKGDKFILYIGKAQRKKGLRKRLKEYVEYGYGRSTSHRGGRAIWQIENNKQLGICWFKVDNSEIVENQLLKKYKELYGILPVANWKI